VTRSVETGREARQECSLSPILFNFYSKYLIKEALESFENFKLGQVICTVKCADDYWLRKKHCNRA
jgi:hypothetical protein